jgi:hypothetical protein
MEEPTVLDFVKAIITPWRGPPPKIPPLIPDGEVVSTGSAVDIDAQAIERVHADAKPLFADITIPWLHLAVLLFMLVAQRMFEPPDRVVQFGAILYILSFGLALWAYQRGELPIAPFPGITLRVDPLTVRTVGLGLGILLLVLAFLGLGRNEFNTMNVGLWLVGLGSIMYAFWLPTKQPVQWGSRIRDFISRPKWNISITRWTVVIAAATAMVLFFRVYRLAEVPSDMVSDHAEKLMDVYDILQGQRPIFFFRNTGREPLQFYLITATISLFKTGISFISMKIGTVFLGLMMLPYMYLLGKEVGNRKVGLLAMVLTGIAYWPNVQARIALRFILYPAFVAPALYYLLRGIRTSNRNDFILSGIALGIGLHGYSPIRLLPFVVVVGVVLFLLHRQSKGVRKQTVGALAVLVLISLFVFLPLLRFALENPDVFFYRALSRVGTIERDYPGPIWRILLENTWNALRMMNWSDGSIWVVSVPGRPALDVVSAAFFLLGVALLLVRYLMKRHWLDLFLLVSVPMLMLPSILALAFPDENPAPNRAGGAIVVVFLIVALAMEGLLRGIEGKVGPRWGGKAAWIIGLMLVAWSGIHNYDLVFNQYNQQFQTAAWNTSELGAVIDNFAGTVGDSDSAWVVAYPHWVDTRLVAMNAGLPTKDYAIWPDAFETTIERPGPKLFLINPLDVNALEQLREIYPKGASSLYNAETVGKDFIIFFVPAEE